MTSRTLTLTACALALGVGAASAAAVPISVPRIVVNDGHTVRAEGVVRSPPGADRCTALVRAQLQVGAVGGWRVVRALGRHRINVCQSGDSGWTQGGFYVRFGGIEYLRSQPARLCWSATQTMSGVPSTHVACKRFALRGGS